MNFAEVRQKFPEYSDLSDMELAKGLHKKFYSDMSFDDFSNKIGLDDYMFSPEKLAERREQLAKDTEGRILAFDEGMTGGWGKKTIGRVGGALGGAAAGVVNALDGGNVADIWQGAKEGWDNQNELRQIQKAYEEENPYESLGIKLVGGVASPIFKLGGAVTKAGKAVNSAVGAGKLGKAAEIATNIIGQGGVGGLYGIAQGSGTAEDASQYLASEKPLKDAVTGAVFQSAVPVVGETVKLAAPVIGKGLKNIAGFMTGTGSESVGKAVEAGKQGSKVFVDNMRRNVSPEEVVGRAKEELQNMVSANNDLYKANMADAFADTTELNVGKVSNKLGELINKETLGGEIPLAAEEKKVLEKTYEYLRPAFKSRVARTTQGLDKIRRKVADINTEFGTNAHRLKKAMENIIKDTISEQRPEYRKGLQTYAKNKAEIEEIAKTFSLEKSLDTALRKLQSVGRNNVQTNYGYRNQLLDTLDFGGDISNAIAGQAFNTILPRSQASRVLAGLAGLHFNPMALLASPRLIGETAYGLGRLSSRAKNLKDIAAKVGLINAAAAANQKNKKN